MRKFNEYLEIVRHGTRCLSPPPPGRGGKGEKGGGKGEDGECECRGVR